MTGKVSPRHLLKWQSAALVVVLCSTFLFAAMGLLPVPIVTLSWSRASLEDSTQYKPSFTEPRERELALIYFGSASCGWANHPDLPHLISNAKTALLRRASMLNASFSAMGIALDWDARVGVRHLDKIGDFDEIAAGRYVYGRGVLAHQHLLNGTPQVSVLVRTMQESTGGYPRRFDERELIRMTSMDQIASWVRRGAPLPTD